MADSASAPAPAAPATAGERRRPTAAPGPIELSDEKTVQTLATPDSFGAPMARLSPSPTGHGYGSTPPSASRDVAPRHRRANPSPRPATPKPPTQRHIRKTRRQFPGGSESHNSRPRPHQGARRHRHAAAAPPNKTKKRAGRLREPAAPRQPARHSRGVPLPHVFRYYAGPRRRRRRFEL